MPDVSSLASSLALPWRILLLVLLALAAHLVVLVIKRTADRISRSARSRELRKIRSISTLATSILVFTLYFLVLGFILHEFGVSLTTFFASASVIGLAVGFGSQGLVQDVVTGLTLIFSDLIDVGDLVEISGQTGIVESITMRFVRLQNALGAQVSIPNRTISSVINYPRGYVRCVVDVTLLGDAAQQSRMRAVAARVMNGFGEQFPGTLIVRPSLEGEQHLESGKRFLRLVFPVWPNRSGPIETIFSQELAQALKREHADYEAWMISVSYEAEPRPSATGRARLHWLPQGRRKTH